MPKLREFLLIDLLPQSRGGHVPALLIHACFILLAVNERGDNCL